MERWTDWLLLPFKAVGALAKITGRITVGVVGILIMGAGLLCISPLGLWYVGVPLLAVGLLLLARAIF